MELMFAEYIQAALELAQYRIIEDEEPYFATVPGLPGVWASGKTFEDCRRELITVIEGWILLRLRMGRSIPTLGKVAVRVSTEPANMETAIMSEPMLSKDWLRPDEDQAWKNL